MNKCLLTPGREPITEQSIDSNQINLMNQWVYWSSIICVWVTVTCRSMGNSNVAMSSKNPSQHWVLNHKTSFVKLPASWIVTRWYKLGEWLFESSKFQEPPETCLLFNSYVSGTSLKNGLSQLRVISCTTVYFKNFWCYVLVII